MAEVKMDPGETIVVGEKLPLQAPAGRLSQRQKATVATKLASQRRPLEAVVVRLFAMNFDFFCS